MSRGTGSRTRERSLLTQDLIPRGTVLTWKVIGEDVYRHYSFDIPNPLFPTDLAKSVNEKRKLES